MPPEPDAVSEATRAKLDALFAELDGRPPVGRVTPFQLGTAVRHIAAAHNRNFESYRRMFLGMGRSIADVLDEYESGMIDADGFQLDVADQLESYGFIEDDQDEDDQDEEDDDAEDA